MPCPRRLPLLDVTTGAGAVGGTARRDRGRRRLGGRGGRRRGGRLRGRRRGGGRGRRGGGRGVFLRRLRRRRRRGKGRRQRDLARRRVLGRLVVVVVRLVPVPGGQQERH